MTKLVFKNLLVFIILSAWFGGIVFFYDYDKDDYQMTYRAKKDQAALNMLKNSEIFEENITVSSRSF